MKFLKSRPGAALVTALVVVFSVVFGAGRSLNAVRSDIWTVYDQGVNGDGHSVREDLGARYATCANLYTVAARYLPAGDPGLRDLNANLEVLAADLSDPFAQADSMSVAELVFMALDQLPLSGQDAGYVAGFRQELDSRAFSIARDPYTEMARTFNDRTLTAFPANLLHGLAGVRPLPVYS